MHQLYGREVGVASGCGLTTDVSGRGTKRPVPDDECAEESAVDSKRVRDNGQPEPDMKGDPEGRGQGTGEEHDFNLPLPWEGGVPCLVKVQIHSRRNFDTLIVHSYTVFIYFRFMRILMSSKFVAVWRCMVSCLETQRWLTWEGERRRPVEETSSPWKQPLSDGPTAPLPLSLLAFTPSQFNTSHITTHSCRGNSASPLIEKVLSLIYWNH